MPPFSSFLFILLVNVMSQYIIEKVNSNEWQNVPSKKKEWQNILKRFKNRLPGCGRANFHLLMVG
jgi:hypothetical protein